MACHGETTLATDAAGGAERLVGRIAGAIGKFREARTGIAAIGLCTPGPISVRDGTIVYIASIGWRNVPIVEMLEKACGLPVAFENDANAAAYAEYAEASKSMDIGDLIYVTVSTGIGAGIVSGGRLLRGARDSAGELGHICVAPGGRQCSCGNLGCLEAYASGTAIAARAREMAEARRSGALFGLCGGDCAGIDAKMAAEAALKGDQDCLAIWDDAAKRLGHGISILAQLFDPRAIVFGGGVSNSWALFGEKMTERAMGGMYASKRGFLEIRPSALGGASCRRGAALLAMGRLAGAALSR
jgi:glucokinase